MSRSAASACCSWLVRRQSFHKFHECTPALQLGTSAYNSGHVPVPVTGIVQDHVAHSDDSNLSCTHALQGGTHACSSEKILQSTPIQSRLTATANENRYSSSSNYFRYIAASHLRSLRCGHPAARIAFELQPRLTVV